MEQAGLSYSADMQMADGGAGYDSYGGAEEPAEFPEGDSVASRPCLPVSIHQMRKQQQETMKQAQLIENRINHLQRTEEQIWREMEDARRKAVKMELGKQRKTERHDVSATIVETKSKKVLENQVRVSKQKADSEVARNENVETRQQLSLRAGTLAREQAHANVLKKKTEQQRDRFNKTKQAEDIRKERELARTRVNLEKEERIQKLRSEQQKKCFVAERDLENAGSRLHDLDQREMACLDKLRLSLQMKQEAMQRIEASVGSSSVITSLLSTKAMNKSTIFFAEEVARTEADVAARLDQADRSF